MAIRFGCQIDFDNDGQYEAAEDVSADLRRLEFRRGRGYSPLTLWRAATGRATVVLRNTSGDYSPSNRNGPYFGNFRPGRRLRILWAEGSGALVPAWSGFMTAPDIRPRLSSVNQTLLRAEGPFAILNREIVHVIGALGRTEGDAINAVLDAAGWPAVDRDIDDGVLTELGLHWVGGISALEAMRQVAATGLGVLFEGRDGKVVYQNRRRRLTPPYNVAAYRFGDYPGVLPYGEPREHDGLAGILNQFEAEVRSYSVGAAAAEVWSSSEPSARVGVNEQITLIAQSAAVGRVGVLDWTDPVVADFTMKANADGSGAGVPFSVAAFRKSFDRMEIDLTEHRPGGGIRDGGQSARQGGDAEPERDRGRRFDNQPGGLRQTALRPPGSLLRQPAGRTGCDRFHHRAVQGPDGTADDAGRHPAQHGGSAGGARYRYAVAHQRYGGQRQRPRHRGRGLLRRV